jgi:hypothetical protein
MEQVQAFLFRNTLVIKIPANTYRDFPCRASVGMEAFTLMRF